MSKRVPVLLSIKKACKSYKDVVVIDELSMDVHVGERLAIIGRSGSGKSTLLRCINGLEELDSGEIAFDDQVVQHRSKQILKIRSQIGFVFQSYHLIDELTVYENLETPLIYKKIRASERKSMVADILDRFQIVGKKDLFPSQLSGGQQQLVGVARAVITSPKLILADEPTGNLNSAQGEEIMGLFRKLNMEGTTIVQVTHSEKNASYGSRTIRLLDGRVMHD